MGRVPRVVSKYVLYRSTSTYGVYQNDECLLRGRDNMGYSMLGSMLGYPLF